MSLDPRCPAWMLPATTSGPAPLLILLHGVGGNETSMTGLARALDPRFIRVVLRSPLSFGPQAFGWFHVDFTPVGPVHNAQEAEAGRRLLVDWIPEAVKEYGADPKRVYLLGFSQGAIMAMSVLLTRPDRVAGAVAWSGRILPEAVQAAAPGATLGQRQALVIHGQADRTLPVHHGQASRDHLTALGLGRVDYHELPIGHEVTGEVLALTNAWLDQVLATTFRPAPLG